MFFLDKKPEVTGFTKLWRTNPAIIKNKYRKIYIIMRGATIAVLWPIANDL